PAFVLCRMAEGRRAEANVPQDDARVPVMGLTHNVGLGDVVKYGIGKLGIKEKPGCKCPERQAWLNSITPGYRKARMPSGERISARALVSLPGGPIRTGRYRESPRMSYPGLRMMWPIAGGATCDFIADTANLADVVAKISSV